MQDEVNAMGNLPTPLYTTRYGAAYVGDSFDLLARLEDSSVDLVVTSPPFDLQHQKKYASNDGLFEKEDYIIWLMRFTAEVKRVLKDTGSMVLDLGGAYQKDRPVRSLYNFRALIKMCDEQGWNLAEEFFWHNPAKLPSPAEWVTKRKIRVVDSVDTVWWLSKTDNPRADVNRVLRPYSSQMEILLEDWESYYKEGDRPSGHKISKGFGKANKGSIPSNLLEISNTESNSRYLRCCKIVKIDGHPARFPERLPLFFIEFLTRAGDTVLDIFAGSNTTGAMAERTQRRWMAFELDHGYLAASAFRFVSKEDQKSIIALHQDLMANSSADVLLPRPAIGQKSLLGGDALVQ